MLIGRGVILMQAQKIGPRWRGKSIVDCKNPLTLSFAEGSATMFLPKIGQRLCREYLTIRGGQFVGNI